MNDDGAIVVAYQRMPKLNGIDELDPRKGTIRMPREESIAEQITSENIMREIAWMKNDIITSSKLRNGLRSEIWETTNEEMSRPKTGRIYPDEWRYSKLHNARR